VVFGVLAAPAASSLRSVVYARNITDVDDKINAAAIELGVPITAITDKYTAAYRMRTWRAGRAATARHEPPRPRTSRRSSR
jgi:cysteinyl-tRNA synthetase